ncbi:serine protease [Nonomuraea sp. K274]|uniref:Serine protease n=1 Tax=Nonomuraea cypriaca TaxID=1187855 RepID=A0A931EYU2_9ACTN|nr:SSI family serine proteinase inhibitor [Nonomuraea cypriaca]MBF8189139.1 serine protease [Nonomuraea cypriaca]
MTFALTAARRVAALGLCVAATLAAPFAALPASAAAGADLYITVTPSNSGAYSMHLTCDPDGGLHPRPARACDVLRDVDGWIERVNVNPGPCPMIYLPVEVKINGEWYGRPTTYQREFPNKCVMDRRLGPIV